MTLTPHQEAAALAALRRMTDKQRDLAVGFLIKFAPSAPVLKLVSGGRNVPISKGVAQSPGAVRDAP
jgi:hypothetical protein